ncbi:hypothetical protein EJP82_02550 [Paenibacillus anaericanus]|uniref:Copper amine oxidase-like N-terminal domain-containing protein n=1 Tax=Paenibacillus anaericanus TaxID=170367 RepID=A0A433YDU4_9BACL|nr:stalk domain-containing protein [Paenibacillus anaericanus]RUT48044.1 hypothetical protein EJP82_02550 [Paenibacillus anaericanus]
MGLCCGLLFAGTSVAVASDSIQALLFPASFEINGTQMVMSKDYKVLNVDGHVYVPIRYVAVNLGATIDYDADLQKIFVKNAALNITDPDYKEISIGNLILTKAGKNTKVTGQLEMQGVGNSKNVIKANLSFYNDNSEKIGEVAISGKEFGVDSQTFVAVGSGDFRTYSAVNLHISAINDQVIDETPNIAYENSKYKFTLDLPKSWEGKYEVKSTLFKDSGKENIDFIDKANHEFGGVVFTIQVWPKAKWNADGKTTAEMVPLFKIGEKGDQVFTLTTPTDVQYDLNDVKLSEEYKNMHDYINTIKTSFKLKQ